MVIDENALIISIVGTVLVWVIFRNELWDLINFLADNINTQFLKIKELEKKNKIDPLPDGREFDKHFLSVMKKSEGRHRLNDRDRKVMSVLYEQDRFERTREEIERRYYH